MYVACRYNVRRIAPDGTNDVVYQGRVLGLTSDASGTVYVSSLDSDQHNVVGTLNGDGTLTTLVDVNAVTGDPYLLITHLAVDGAGTSTAHRVRVQASLGPHTARRAWSSSRPGTPCTGSAPPRSPRSPVTANPTRPTPPKPATATSSPISPTGISVDDGGNLLVASGHVVYRIADAKGAALWDGTACNPTTIHPGAGLSGAQPARPEPARLRLHRHKPHRREPRRRRPRWRHLRRHDRDRRRPLRRRPHRRHLPRHHRCPGRTPRPAGPSPTASSSARAPTSTSPTSPAPT